jgi:hypothetical protein
MNDEINWLITLVNANQLLRCALKVKREQLSEDCIEHPMEPENLKKIKALLPVHIRSHGPIVEISQIFEITTNERDTIIIEVDDIDLQHKTWHNVISTTTHDAVRVASRIILKTRKKDKYIVVKDRHLPTPYEIISYGQNSTVEKCKNCGSLGVQLNTNGICTLCKVADDVCYTNDFNTIKRIICAVGNEILKYDPTKEQIMAYIREQTETNLEDILEAFDITKAKARRILFELVETGMLAMREDTDKMIVRIR